MVLYYVIWSAVLGLLVGSFLNVCIDRLPRGESIVVGRSHCQSCGHPLAISDLVPVLSYLWLGRRCRYCGDSIPGRYMVIELTTGVAFGLITAALQPDKFGWRLGLVLIGCAVYAAGLVWLMIRHDRRRTGPGGQVR